MGQALGCGYAGLGFRQLSFLVHGHAREAVVGRIAEDDEYRRLLLHPLRAVALLLELGKGKRLGRARLPAGERVGEEHAGALAPIIGERRIEVLHRQANLQMGDDEGRGHDLEAEHPLGRRLPDPCAGERPEALTFEIGGDAAQHLRQIGAGTAARVEHEDVLRRESVRDAEVVLQRPVHPRDHVADHFGRRVPDAELLAQRRVERFEEGLVEVRHRLAFVEAGEERLAVHPVEGGGGPVQHLDQAERLQATGLGELLEQRLQHRGAQVPDRLAPTESPCTVATVGGARPAAGGARPGARARPQHPGGEDAVEQGLHQGRVEEARAFLALEAHPERLFERGAHRGERGRVARRLDPREPVAGVGGEQPCQVPRLGQRGPVGQGATEVLDETRTDLAGEDARRLQLALERGVAAGEPEGLERGLLARRVLADERELAEIGRQHQTVAAPVAPDLLAHHRAQHVLVRGLDLDHAAFRNLALARASPLHLPGRVEAEVGMTRALVGQLADAEHLRLEGRADGVEQVRERPVARSLPGRPAGGADPPQIFEIRLHRRDQLRVRTGHGPRGGSVVGACGRAAPCAPSSTASHAASSQPWKTTARPRCRTDGMRRRNPSSAR